MSTGIPSSISSLHSSQSIDLSGSQNVQNRQSQSGSLPGLSQVNAQAQVPQHQVGQHVGNNVQLAPPLPPMTQEMVDRSERWVTSRNNDSMSDKGVLARVRNFFKQGFAKESGKLAGNLTHVGVGVQRMQGASVESLTKTMDTFGVSKDWAQAKEVGKGSPEAGITGAIFSLVADSIKVDDLRAQKGDAKTKIVEYARLSGDVVAEQQNVQTAQTNLDQARQQARDGTLPLNRATSRLIQGLENQLQQAQQALTTAQDRVKQYEATHLLGIKLSTDAKDQLGMAGFAVFRSTAGVVVGGYRVVQGSLEMAKTITGAVSSAMSSAGSIAGGVAGIISIPVDAAALARDVRDIKAHQKLNQQVKAQQQLLQGKDSELESCLKLIKSKQVVGEKRFSAAANGIKVAAGAVSTASAITAICVTAGVTTAAALTAASMLTPIGWAVAGVAAGITIGFGIYKLCKYIHTKKLQQGYMDAIANPGGPAGLKIAGKLRLEGIQNPTPDQIKARASEKLLSRSASFTSSTLMARVKSEPRYDATQPDASPTAKMLSGLGFSEKELHALYDSNVPKDAQKLLSKKLKLG